MATGGADFWEFFVAWDRVSYVDESAYLMAAEGKAVTVTRGAAEWVTQPGVLSGTLENSSGRFTADNPLSPLFGMDPDDAYTLFRVTKDATTYVRHRGRLSVAVPQFDEAGNYTTSVVPFQATDVLGRLAGVTLRAEFVERWITTVPTSPADIFALDEAANVPTTLQNLGDRGATGAVVPASSRAGTAARAAPDGIVLDSTIALAHTNGVGPVIVLSLRSDATANDVVIPFRTADRIKAGKSARWIAQGLDATGGEEWSLRLVDSAGATEIRFYDSTGGSALVYAGFADVGDSEVGDDQWWALEVFIDVGVQHFRLYRVSDQSLFFASTSAGYDLALTRTVVLGGDLAGRRSGAQRNCTSTTFGAVGVAHSGRPSHIGYLQPNATEPAQTRVVDLRAYGGVSSSVAGTRNRTVTLRPTSGRSPFEGLAELATTTGGVVVASLAATQTVAFLDSDVVRLPTVALTIGVEEDAGTDLPWAKVPVPSRVTANYPAGAVTYEDATRTRLDETVETCAADDAGALDVAAFAANAGRRLRLTQITVDLAGAANDVWAAVMALEVGARVRVVLGAADSPLVAQYGWTFVDCFVTGWTERYAEGVAEWDLLLMPADDPVEGVWDDADRGRWTADGTMTVTGGTAVGTTATGTIVVTTTGSNPTWSTDAADYPLDVDWNGERVTVTSAPAGAGSPQTLTITARGVAPSVARVHATGEPVDVWTGAAWTI